MDFYTYIYYDPTKGNEPFYVGKGKDNRAWFHQYGYSDNHLNRRIKKIINKGKQPIIGLYAGLDEEFALFLEEELIRHIGRRDLKQGPLVNLTNGGDGVSGHIHTRETRKRMSEAARKRARRSMSEEQKQKVAAVHKGKKVSPETVAKRLQTMRNKKEATHG